MQTAERLNTLENETRGELALGTTTIVSGWSVRVLPSGEKVATAELDYIVGTDVSFDEQYIAYLQENLPNVFTAVYSCECKVTDISIGRTYLNSMLTAVSELVGTSATDKVAVIPLETNQGNANYTTPTKLHAAWTVRGI